MMIEIQEFYEMTLCDDGKSLQEKTDAVLEIASKWERAPPIHLSPAVPPAGRSQKMEPHPILSSVQLLLLLQFEITCNSDLGFIFYTLKP